MSLEVKDVRPFERPAEASHEPRKESRISYTRDFLLSLSKSEACKKLPSEFDQSILSEFDGASDNVQERQRISGSFSSQSFRRAEYSSSPPSRGDLSNYSRGTYGRWDNRATGRSDKDGDSQSDLESDGGRRYGSQTRRSWQSSEHDGLLGSGSFPRPSGYAIGSSAAKVRPNDHSQLNRGTEPYHPPRPYKAITHPRKDGTDLLNDETFGSSDCTSEDRAEDERRRRASFELMRKEQRALLEKEKLNLDQNKEKFVTDITFLLEDSKDRKTVAVNNVLDVSLIESTTNNGSGKSLSSHALASRPLVPPGFTSAGLERNLGTKSSCSSLPQEVVGNDGLHVRSLHANDGSKLNKSSLNQEEKRSVQKIGFSVQQFETVDVHLQLVDEGENVDPSSIFEASSELNKMDSESHKVLKVLDSCDALVDRGITKLDAEKMRGPKTMDGDNQSATILEKLFGTASIKDGGSPKLIEHHDSKEGDMWSPQAKQSSKFAHWFLEEEKKTVDEYSSGKSTDLLSLIVGGDKGATKVSDVEPTEQVQPVFLTDISDHDNNHMASSVSASAVEITEQLYNGNTSEGFPPVLTCEDLEQSILSGICENTSTLLPSIQGQDTLDAKSEQSRVAGDDPASQHLLSLLQKGASKHEIAPSSNANMVSSSMLHAFDSGICGVATSSSKQDHPEKVNGSGSTLTLETLFGSAFMKELQDSVGSARIDVSEPQGVSSLVTDDNLLPQTIDRIGSNMTDPGSSDLMSNGKQANRLGNLGDHWLRFDDSHNGMDRRNIQNEVGPKLSGFDAESEIRLPEEENLFAISDPVNPSGSFIPPVSTTKSQLSTLSNTSAEIAEKLASLNGVQKNERHLIGQDGSPFLRSLYGLMEPEVPLGNPHLQSSTTLLQGQMNHGMFHRIDSQAAHINPQTKLMPPRNNILYDVPPNQLPGNMLPPHFQHPNPGLPGFDPRGQHPILHQMQVPGNYAPPEFFGGLPRGGSLPTQPDSHATGFLHNASVMQGFPFGHRNPNFGSPGMALPAPDVGSGNNHPEMLQRLLEMELRSNAKPMSHFPIANHTQGTYGHELDTGFRYR